MEETKPFYDFCIPYNKDENILRFIFKDLVELGYKTIAIEETFDHTQKDVSKRGADIFPAPCNIKGLKEEFKDHLKVLHRMTIIYSDSAVAHAMLKSVNLKKYNLIAGLPKNDAALNHCCTAFSGDILTFEPETFGRLKANRTSCSVAVKRGVFIEIKYALAIVDSSNRKDMIKMAHNFCKRGKSKNIIFSSGAKNSFQLRGPNDVAHLAYIFNMSEDQGKNAVNRTCRELILKAESRRIGKTIMICKSLGPIVLSDNSSDDEEESVEDTDDSEILADVKMEKGSEDSDVDDSDADDNKETDENEDNNEDTDENATSESNTESNIVEEHVGNKKKKKNTIQNLNHLNKKKKIA